MLNLLRFGEVTSTRRPLHGGGSAGAPASFVAPVAALAAAGLLLVIGDQVIENSDREVEAASAVFAVHTVAALSLMAWALWSFKSRRHEYWLATGLVAFSMICFVALAVHVDHLDVLPLLDARAVLRLTSYHFTAIQVFALLPGKAWVLTVVALAPVLLGHPISFLSNAGSWAAQQGADGWLQYALACIFTSAACSASLASSYGGEAAHRSANEARSRLALQARIGEGQLGEPHAVERDSNDPRVVPMQAARSQALLETAMPSEVAQALLRGVPMQKLSESYDSASVAFIALAGFDARMARMAPKEQLQWLNGVYQALDSLVDEYGGAVSKVETVANTYLVAAGISRASAVTATEASATVASHAHTLACFCLDALDILRDELPAAGLEGTAAKVGLHSGPLTAGLIGQSRCYYRIFGDTVNVASRMMSTGEVGRVQASAEAVRCMLGISVTDSLPQLDVGARLALPVDALAPPSQPSLVYRGLTKVKGKGEMPTFWVESTTPSTVDATHGFIPTAEGDDSFILRSGGPIVADATYLRASSFGAAPTVAGPPIPRVSSFGAVPPAPLPALQRVASSGAALPAVGSAMPRVSSFGAAFNRVMSFGAAQPGAAGHTMPRVASFGAAAVPVAAPAPPSPRDLAVAQGGPSRAASVQRGLSSYVEAVHSSGPPSKGQSSLGDGPGHKRRVIRAPKVARSKAGLVDTARNVYLENACRDLWRAPATFGVASAGRRGSASVAPAPPEMTSRSTDRAPQAGSDGTLERERSGPPSQGPGPGEGSSIYGVGQAATRRNRSRRFSSAEAIGAAEGGIAVRSVAERMQRRASRRLLEVDALAHAVFETRAQPSRLPLEPPGQVIELARADDGAPAPSSPPQRRPRSSVDRPSSPAPASVPGSDHASVVTASTAAGQMSAGLTSRPVAPFPTVQQPRHPPAPYNVSSMPTAPSLQLKRQLRAALAALRLGFSDATAELRAQQVLFAHTLAGFGVVTALWAACVLTLLAISVGSGAAIGGPGANSARAGALLVALIICVAMSAAARWLSRTSPGHGSIVIFFSNAFVATACIAAVAALVFFAVGPGPPTFLPSASAFSAKVSSAPGAGPFEGQLLLCVGVVVFMQGVAHMRLPFAHTSVVCAAAVICSLCIAAPLMTSVGKGLPSAVTGICIFDFVVAVVVNAAMVALTSYAWESRCRNQLLLTAAAETAEADAMRLLTNLMPPSIVADIKAGRHTEPVQSKNVVILNSDIVGFTALASTLPAIKLMRHLNAIYSAFDRIVEKHGLWKIETVGDAYIVAGGLFDSPQEVAAANSECLSRVYDGPVAGTVALTRKLSMRRLSLRRQSQSRLSLPRVPIINSAQAAQASAAATRARIDNVFGAALEMVEFLNLFRTSTGLAVQMRVGIHIGDVVHGVVGSESPRFCLLGEAMTIAEKTQSTARPGTIRCSDEAREAYLASSYHFDAEEADDDALNRTIASGSPSRLGISADQTSLQVIGENSLLQAESLRPPQSRHSSSGATSELNNAELSNDVVPSPGSLASPDQSIGVMSLGVARLAPLQRPIMASPQQHATRGAQRSTTYTVRLATPRED